MPDDVLPIHNLLLDTTVEQRAAFGHTRTQLSQHTFHPRGGRQCKTPKNLGLCELGYNRAQNITFPVFLQPIRFHINTILFPRTKANSQNASRRRSGCWCSNSNLSRGGYGCFLYARLHNLALHVVIKLIHDEGMMLAFLQPITTGRCWIFQIPSFWRNRVCLPQILNQSRVFNKYCSNHVFSRLGYRTIDTLQRDFLPVVGRHKDAVAHPKSSEMKNTAKTILVCWSKRNREATGANRSSTIAHTRRRTLVDVARERAYTEEKMLPVGRFKQY